MASMNGVPFVLLGWLLAGTLELASSSSSPLVGGGRKSRLMRSKDDGDTSGKRVSQRLMRASDDGYTSAQVVSSHGDSESFDGNLGRSAAKRFQTSGEGSDVKVEQPMELRCRSQNKIELCESLEANGDCTLNDGGLGTCQVKVKAHATSQTGSVTVKSCKKTKATPADNARAEACSYYGAQDGSDCKYTKTNKDGSVKTNKDGTVKKQEGKCGTRFSDAVMVCKKERNNPKVDACGDDADPDQPKEAGDCCSYIKKGKGRKGKKGKKNKKDKVKSGICELSERTNELKCKRNKAPKADTVGACSGLSKGDECTYTTKKGEEVIKMCLPYTVRDQCGSTYGGAGTDGEGEQPEQPVQQPEQPVQQPEQQPEQGEDEEHENDDDAEDAENSVEE